MTERPAAFDDLASDYDRAFGASILGGMFRARVQARLDRAFRPGQRVLELGCGTGEDALHLARRGVRVMALDASAGMLAVAARKVSEGRHEAFIELRKLPVEDLWRLGAGQFDGAYSNFGALNCVANLAGLAAGLAGLITPGGSVIAVVMGPLAAWEWVWFAAHRQPAKAFRRMRRGGISWRGTIVRYPSAIRVARAFSPWFTVSSVLALGGMTPGTYAESWAARHPRALATLDRVESALASLPALWMLADHYILELARAPANAGGAG